MKYRICRFVANQEPHVTEVDTTYIAVTRIADQFASRNAYSVVAVILVDTEPSVDEYAETVVYLTVGKAICLGVGLSSGLTS